MSDSDSFDQKAFRAALGAFATGVTVVTTADSEGRPVGLTCSSFNSVSLDPPLVLWSLRRESATTPIFQDAGKFAVHVLESEKEEVSNLFASSADDKFEQVGFTMSEAGTPHIGTCAARFECETAHQYEGGDHIIFVGKVTSFEAADGCAPLVFHGGRYARLV